MKRDISTIIIGALFLLAGIAIGGSMLGFFDFTINLDGWWTVFIIVPALIAIAQGGFITAWLDAAMAHAVIHDTDHAQTVFSLEIKVSFYEKVGPGDGRVEGRVVRRGKRVAFLEASLFNAEGKLAAQATSTGILANL